MLRGKRGRGWWLFSSTNKNKKKTSLESKSHQKLKMQNPDCVKNGLIIAALLRVRPSICLTLTALHQSCEDKRNVSTETASHQSDSRSTKWCQTTGQEQCQTLMAKSHGKCFAWTSSYDKSRWGAHSSEINTMLAIHSIWRGNYRFPLWIRLLGQDTAIQGGHRGV